MHAIGFKKSALVALLLAAGLSTSAHATVINAETDGRWYQFDIDEEIAGNVNWIDGITDNEVIYHGDYSNLSFTFTLNNSGVLTVVDAGIAGDEFEITVNGNTYNTSNVGSFSSAYAYDFDSALADSSNFSSLTIQLAPGTYTVTGLLSQSAIDEIAMPYNVTVGGLSVSEVPLPAGAWLFGSALMACAARTRRRA